MKKTAVLLTLLLCSFCVKAQKTERNLSSDEWKFRNQKEAHSYKSSVPGSVHTDLLLNGLIPDPFFGDNENVVQWIEKETWVYETDFLISAMEIRKKHIVLRFEGLDTYADVYLNSSLIFSTDNMFRAWELNVKPLLKKGKNQLKVVFHPTVEKARQAAAMLSYTLPGEERVFARTGQYKFGWDWGPRMLGCGIWKDVKLIAYDQLRIHSTECKQTIFADSLAILDVKLHLENSSTEDFRVTASLSGNGEVLTQTTNLKSGEQVAHLRFTIRNPKLWWCNGLGEAFLYDLAAEVSKDNKKYDELHETIGLRTISLVQQADSIGKTFYFTLNGQPVFMKGANWIPADYFPHRLTAESYEKLIDAAANANMNMLRVWGGGIYESDAFYTHCDKKGILVWQDFMFACAMYPGDSAFLSTVKKEAEEQIIRLRKHACIALWCGNNEIIEGWYNWGWQQQYNYSVADSQAAIGSYKLLFEEMLPSLVQQHDPGRIYHPSSPANGWGRDIAYTEGDLHYWGVWWGGEPFDKYLKKTGRFVSEYGFQGMPSYESFTHFIPPSELAIGSASVSAHQKHPTGFKTINEYMERDFVVPKTFEDYIYVSQLLQTHGIKTAIEAHRRAMPRCMGTLYWQLNDCWPVTSWSSIDYYGKSKALLYQVEESFSPILVRIEENSGFVDVFIISDSPVQKSASLQISLFNFRGELLFQQLDPIEIEALCSKSYKRLCLSNLIPDTVSRNSLMLKAQVIDGSNVLSENSHFFVRPKDLDLKPSQVELEYLSNELLLLRCIDYLAKSIYLEAEGVEFFPNFFDLLPGEEKLVLIKPHAAERETPIELKVNHLYNTIRNE